MPKQPRISDVAQVAAVSVGTVSHVLNAPERVAPGTRARVLAAIEATGYVRRRGAAQLRTRRSGLIGIIVPDVGNPFWGEVVAGAESVLEQEGLTLVIGSGHQRPDRERSLALTLAEYAIDGLLLATADAQLPPTFRGLPTVLLDRHGEELGLASVSVDDELGAFQAFEHLMDLGHRRIGFVTGPPSFPWFSERCKGVVRALRRRRVRYTDAVVEVAVDEVTVAAGEQAGRQLLAGANRPTAAFCVNDLLALGVLRALRSEGLTAPQHLSLVGYDDLAFAGALSPALTTVRQQPFDIGRLGATLLLDASVQRHLVLQPELIVRDSTSPCRPDRPRTRRRRSS